jgi:hypothetical protein
MVPVNDLHTLPDAELAFEAQLLERKVVALRTATSAIGVSLLQQYRERLDEVRNEIARRRA